MILTKYRGYLICQQKEFGPLRLLRWVEGGEYIIIKNNGNAMPGARFGSPEEAKQAIDITEQFYKRRLA